MIFLQSISHTSIRGAKRGVLILLAAAAFGYGVQYAGAQATPNVLYVPLIGITSVPTPLALPEGPGDVTYKYAVRNFLSEYSLTDVTVFDDTCSPIVFTEGDDNNDSKLDYTETWRYTCTTRLSATTQSTATVKGTLNNNNNNITATHKAYATVVVGSNNPPPLVSVVNITKVAYPLSLPAEGGEITFTYRVNNPGVVPLSSVVVSDDKCNVLSSRLGDTNGNGLLDTHEVWTYTCTTNLTETTTNTVRVTAFANGLQAIGEATLTVEVDTPAVPATPSFPDLPDTGGQAGAGTDINATISQMLSVALAMLLIFFLLSREGARRKTHKKRRSAKKK